MPQIRALCHQIEKCPICDGRAILQLQMRQFRAATRHQLHAAIAHPAAIAQHDALNLRTRAGPALAAQTPEDRLQRTIAAGLFACCEINM